MITEIGTDNHATAARLLAEAERDAAKRALEILALQLVVAEHERDAAIQVALDAASTRVAAEVRAIFGINTPVVRHWTDRLAAAVKGAVP